MQHDQTEQSDVERAVAVAEHTSRVEAGMAAGCAAPAIPEHVAANDDPEGDLVCEPSDPELQSNGLKGKS